MLKKLTLLITTLALLISFSACSNKNNDENDKKDDENTSVSEKEAETETEEATEQPTQTTEPDSEEPDIKFSESRASFIGTFYSQIYGNLNVYLQEGYFLLIDEYEETKFTVFANNYSHSSEAAESPVFEDMNFDGNTDFAVCYAKDGENLYYYCFLWNGTEKSYVYYNPLASLANPVFDSENCQIISNYKKSKTKIREDIYIFNGSDITLAFTKDIEIAPESDTGAEINSAKLSVLENGNSALISLKANEETHSVWAYYIEDKSIVSVSSDYFDEKNSTYEFLLSAVSQGSTTVIFRYETVEDGDYVEERIINVIIDEDKNVKIFIPDESYENEEAESDITDTDITE